MKRMMASSRFATEVETPCFSLRWVSLAKKPKAAFSHGDDVGVKGHVQRGWRANQSRSLACLWVAWLSRIRWIAFPAGTSRLMAFQEVDELLMAVTLHVLRDDRAIKDIVRRRAAGVARRDISKGSLSIKLKQAGCSDGFLLSLLRQLARTQARRSPRRPRPWRSAGRLGCRRAPGRVARRFIPPARASRHQAPLRGLWPDETPVARQRDRCR